MLELTKTPPTNMVELSFSVPSHLIDKVIDTMHDFGAQVSTLPTPPETAVTSSTSIPWRKAFGYTDEEMPSVYLRGLRYREDLTQKQLSEKTGIPIRHISEMENNKRPIGKKNAVKLAEVLGCNPRMLLSI